MTQKASCLIVAAIALMAAFAATVVSAAKPVTPELGLYYGRTVEPPDNGTVEVHETEVKVVKIGKRRGAQVRISPFPPTSCTGDQMPGGFYVSEKSPIPIKDGKFKLDRTTQPRIAAGAGTGTMRTVISGTFESPTKVVVKVSVNFSYSVQYPGQPEAKGTCTGKQAGIAKHK
jgi:hypothetical protein